MTLTMTWLIRYGHVVAGSLWLGGYVLLAFIMIPLLAKHRTEVLENLAITTVRVMTYAGTATIAFGLVLVTRTRGFQSVTSFGEWGMIIITCIVIAIALLGIGDGALRPAIQKLTQTGNAKAAQRFAFVGLVLTVVAIGLMTRALYAVS
jgi:hypothetical protein